MSDERKYFGTDGVRGRANQNPMTPEFALRLGRAVALRSLRAGNSHPRIVIGKDTRVSGYMIETALASGICGMGGLVMLCGPMRTAPVANLTHSMRADAGVVISASHNPFEDNGIKLFGPDGFKLPDADELEIERLIDSEEIYEESAFGKQVGRAERIEDATGRYIVYAKNTFPSNLSLKGLRIVVDAAHGAAYKVAPSVFSELGAEVVSVGTSPDGFNINDECGALFPQQLAHEVRRSRADLGIALDGDADRLIVVDENGKTVDGDAVMALCALKMMREGSLKNNTVVATVMSNMGLERALEKMGAKLVRTQVGDRYVVEEMKRSGCNFGGEQSGHLLFLDHATTGDGIVAALQLLAILVREQKPLSELAQVMQRVPQILHNIRLSRRLPVEDMPKLLQLNEQITTTLGKDGRTLLRWSGTEPKLRIMLEGPDEKQLREWAQQLAEAAQADAATSS